MRSHLALKISQYQFSSLKLILVWAVCLWLPACQASLPPSPSPTAVPLAVDIQASALLPEFRSDLQVVNHAPHYRIQVEIDPLAGSFQGSLQLQVTNQEETPLQQLYLRLLPNDGASYGAGELELTQISLDGKAVTPTPSQVSSIVQIDLPEPLQPGAQADLKMRFRGQTPLDFAGDEQGAYGIFNLSEQVLVLSGWYPMLAVYDATGWNLDRVNPVGDAVYSDMATYQVEIKLPTAYTLVATGAQVESRIEGRFSITTWVSGPAREFTLVASPRFGVISTVVDEVKINVFYLDKAQTEGQAVLDVAADALQVFDQQFGVYPYTELDIVQVPLKYAGGVEFPGIIFIEAQRFLQAENPVAVTTVAHEVAHQWWYNLVGNDVFDEPWLDEALASYSSILYWEYAKGSAVYKVVLADYQSRYDQAVMMGATGQITQGMAYYGMPEHAGSYGAEVYAKGALFFDALRKEIGDLAFFAGLQNYLRQYRYQIASGKDLLAEFETASGRSLDSFYQTWLTAKQ